MAHTDVILPAEPARELPAVRSIGPADLLEVLSKGVADFRAMPTHVIFLSLIYPIVGIAIARADIRVRCHSAALSACRRLRADRPLRRHRPLRAEPAARAGPGHLVEACLRHRPLALDLGDRCARAAAGRDLRRLDRGRPRDLRGAFRRAREAGSIRDIRRAGAEHAAGVQPDRRRQRGRLSVRRGGVRAERGVVPAAARPQRRDGGGDRHLVQGHPEEPHDDGLVGTDRRLRPADRLAAVLPRPGRGDAGARAFDLAPVSQGGGARSRARGRNSIRGPRGTATRRISPPRCSCRSPARTGTSSRGAIRRQPHRADLAVHVSAAQFATLLRPTAVAPYESVFELSLGHSHGETPCCR